MIEENSVVLLRRDKVYKGVKLIKGRKVTFERQCFNCDNALGLPFGTEFEVVGDALVPVDKGTITLSLKDEFAVDNRKVFDDGSSQTLSYDDIHDMKRKGISGQTILETVVKGSSSFKDKTKFSQEKYLKKKQKKHKPVVTIIRPSTRLLCQMFYAKLPSKICHIRLDTLSQMLTLSNVRAHSNLVIMETCQGLLTGAVLERMGGHGKLVQVFFGDLPSKTALDSFSHLSSQDLSILMYYPLQRVGQLLNQLYQPSVIDNTRKDDVVRSTIDQETEHEKSLIDIQDCSTTEKDSKRLCLDEDIQETETIEDIVLTKTDTTKETKRKEIEEMHKEAGVLLQTRSMDGLLIACRFHPKDILMSLLQFVAPSRPIVVYSQFQEPLVQCYEELKESGKVFNIQLSETWCREYQVLHERTHPMVNMDGQSGYLLYGTTVTPS